MIFPLIAGMLAACVVSLAAPAQARPGDPRREDINVYSAAMDRWIKIQVMWSARGGNAGLYLLDGLRGRDDWNAWDLDTDAFRQFSDNNINVIMPVGGRSSFYTDWYFPSNLNGQTYTYKWETFLTEELPTYLETRGVSRANNGIVGLSMGAIAALNLAGHHKDQFKFAASISGYPVLAVPGMRAAIRISMLDEGGYNADSMWGPPWDPAWIRNDPSLNIDKLRGLSLYVSAASGLPGAYNNPRSFIDYFNTGMGIGLEALSLANTRAFQLLATANGLPVTYSFPAAGTHMWRYWQDELWKARPQILNTLSAW
ncbi:MAG: alpha/beta hydrolase [Mycobacteriaceae bacterium]